MKAYNKTKPKSIGVVIGYDIRGKSEPSMGSLIAFGAIGGAIGGIIASESTKEWELGVEAEIINMVWESTQAQFLKKNYDIAFVKSQPNEWKLFEHNTRKNVFSKQVKEYQVEDVKDMYDALLFIEVFIEGRLMGKDTPEDIVLENLKLRFGNAKIFMFDVNSELEIFFKLVQKGYSSFTKKRLPEAINNMTPFDPFPVR